MLTWRLAQVLLNTKRLPARSYGAAGSLAVANHAVDGLKSPSASEPSVPAANSRGIQGNEFGGHLRRDQRVAAHGLEAALDGVAARIVPQPVQPVEAAQVDRRGGSRAGCGCRSR